MSTVIQSNVPDILRDHNTRLRALEGQVGRWVYVLPIAPATDPPGFNPLDPLSVPFQNGWGNTAAEQPTSFRIHPATKIQIRSGGLQGGTIPSVVFTLPANYRPTQAPAPVSFPSSDGLSTFTGRVDMNGDVWILNEITGGAPPTPASLTIVKAQYTGTSVAIPNGGQDFLTWDNLASGTELLDRSTPKFPVVLADGVYQLVAQIGVSGMTAGGFAFVQTQLTGTPMGGSESDAYFPAQVVTFGFSPGASTILVPMLAGDPVGVSVSSYDGAVSRDYYLFNADLIKVSV